jgi:putative methionine-R-sulfoxide reductase with GAF domain
MLTPVAKLTTANNKVREVVGHPESKDPCRSRSGSAEAAMPKTELKRKYDASLEKEIIGNADQQLSAILTTVVERVCLLTGADGAAIALCDPEGVVCRASTGDAPEVGSRLQSDSGFTRECFETGQPVLCEDAENDARVQRSIARGLRLRSALAVPIQAQGFVLGVAEVFSSRRSAFDITDVNQLQRIADQLSSILAQGPARDEKPVTGGPALVPTQVERASSAEDRPATPPSLVLFPAECLVDLPPTTTRVEGGQSASPALTPSIVRSRVGKWITALEWIAAAIMGLGSLSFLLFFVESHHKLEKVPSTKSTPSVSGPARSDASMMESRGVEEKFGAPKLHTVPVEQSKNRTKTFQPGAGLTVTQPDSKPSRAEGLSTGIASLASPMLVIKEARPGAQVFVDDQLTSSVDSGGQAKISSLIPGQHNLRLTLNGYRDYDQRVDLVAGQTFSIAARLEPFDPLILAEPAETAALTSPSPPPVKSITPSLPDFVLDRTLNGHSGWVTAVAFSVDGQRLASASWDQTVKFWDVPTGQELGTVAGKIKEVQALAFSRDGHWLATENSSNTVTLWDATTGQEIRTLPGNKPGVLGNSWVYSIAFSPDGHWLASGLDDKTVRLWDVMTGRVVRDLSALRRSVIYIAFSPDGRWLASGGDDKTIRIWDVSTGQEIRRLSGHKKNIYSVAFSPNGRWLASGSADKSVRLWEVATGREVHTLTGHGNAVTSVAFTPDGRWLASGSWDKTVKIWDVETGHELQTLAGHNRPIYTVAFDSRGRWLAAGSQDGTIKLWQLGEVAEQGRLR